MKLTHETLVMANPEQILLPRFTVSQIMRTDQQVSFRIFFTANHYTFTADDYLVIKYAKPGSDGLPKINRRGETKYFKPPFQPPEYVKNSDSIVFGHLVYLPGRRVYDIDWTEAQPAPEQRSLKMERRANTSMVEEVPEQPPPPTREQRILDGRTPSEMALASDTLDCVAKDAKVRRKGKQKTKKHQAEEVKAMAAAVPKPIAHVDAKSKAYALSETLNRQQLNSRNFTPMATILTTFNGGTWLPTEPTRKEQSFGITLDGKEGFTEVRVPPRPPAQQEGGDQPAQPPPEEYNEVEDDEAADEMQAPIPLENEALVFENDEVDNYVYRVGRIIREKFVLEGFIPDQDDIDDTFDAAFEGEIRKCCGEDLSPQNRFAAARLLYEKYVHPSYCSNTESFISERSDDDDLELNDYENAKHYLQYNAVNGFIVDKSENVGRGLAPVVGRYLMTDQSKLTQRQLDEIKVFYRDGLLRNAFNVPVRANNYKAKARTIRPKYIFKRIPDDVQDEPDEEEGEEDVTIDANYAKSPPESDPNSETDDNQEGEVLIEQCTKPDQFVIEGMITERVDLPVVDIRDPEAVDRQRTCLRQVYTAPADEEEEATTDDVGGMEDIGGWDPNTPLPDPGRPDIPLPDGGPPDGGDDGGPAGQDGVRPNQDRPPYMTPIIPAYRPHGRVKVQSHLRPFINHCQPGYDPVSKHLVWKVRLGFNGFMETFDDYVKLFTDSIIKRANQEVQMASDGRASAPGREIIDEVIARCQQRLYFRSNPGYVYCYWDHCSPRLRRIFQAPYFFRNHHSRHLYWYLICGTANCTELRENTYRILIGRHAFIGRAEEVVVCSYTPITIPGNSFFNPMWVEIRDENDELYPLQVPYILEWTFSPIKPA